LDKGQETFRLRLYQLYAWGGPLLIAGIAGVLDSLPKEMYSSLLRPRFGQERCWFFGTYLASENILKVRYTINGYFIQWLSAPLVEVSRTLTRLSAGNVTVATCMTSNHRRIIRFCAEHVIVESKISGLLYLHISLYHRRRRQIFHLKEDTKLFSYVCVYIYILIS
jgi:hypothetical protein